MIERGNGARRYSVHCSEAVIDSLRRIHRQAPSQGKRLSQ
jgi:hypothetical protein